MPIHLHVIRNIAAIKVFPYCDKRRFLLPSCLIATVGTLFTRLDHVSGDFHEKKRQVGRRVRPCLLLSDRDAICANIVGGEIGAGEANVGGAGGDKPSESERAEIWFSCAHLDV